MTGTIILAIVLHGLAAFVVVMDDRIAQKELKGK